MSVGKEWNPKAIRSIHWTNLDGRRVGHCLTADGRFFEVEEITTDGRVILGAEIRLVEGKGDEG